MNIIYFSSHPQHKSDSPTGYGTHQRAGIQAFKDLGHMLEPVIIADILSKTSPTKEIKSTTNNNIKSLLPRFIINFFKDIKLLKHSYNSGKILEQFIHKNKPSFIYERSEHLMFAGVRMANKHNIPIVLEVNAPFVQEIKKWEGWSPWHWLAHKIERYKMVKAKHIFVVSSALKKHIVNQYKIPENKVYIAPNCINPAKAIYNSKEADNIIKKHSLLNKKVIGFVGSIFPYHGVEMLINAFDLIYKTHKNTALLIVGDGQIIPDLKAKAKQLNSFGQIIFTGNIHHSQVNNYINVMDICTMPNSNWYGSPIKIFEYGAFSKPIIAPNYAPLKDVMEHNINGILIEPTANNLATAITDLLENEEKAKQLGKAFNQKILKNFTWIKSMEKVIKKVN